MFATIAAGGSHVSTATAMAEALELNFPGRFATSVREPMLDYGFGVLDRRHKEGWRKALERPWTIVWGQRLLDALPAATAAMHRRLLGSFARKAAAELARERLDLIVVNHGWLTTALTIAQRRFGLGVPVVTFETSAFNANALWAEPNAERFVVASPISRSRLMRFGIPRQKIDVVGYPVRQAFLCAPDKVDARVRLMLDDRFTCLVLLGGEGVGGRPEEVLAALESLPDIQVVVVTGRNESLRQRLELYRESLPHLRIVGFVEEMPLYLAACDVVIGKSGPATVFEALAVGRPLLAPRRFGSAENKMLALLDAHGLGGYSSGPEELLESLRGYLRDPQSLDAVAERSRQLDFPGMASRLASYLAHYAATREPDREACGKGLALLPSDR